ncbi:hypothetical protein JTB14_001968 [Gonioctena quinquepunctata]|nr:hypothetical protein JTB14_001968 [Gonioctena quinquepunctata]
MSIFQDGMNEALQFLESGDQQIADELLHTLDAARRENWMRTVENLDFKRSSRKAWDLLRRLSGAGMNSACENSPSTTSNKSRENLRHLNTPA